MNYRQISKDFVKSNSEIQECLEQVEDDCLQIDTHEVIDDCNEPLIENK